MIGIARMYTNVMMAVKLAKALDKATKGESQIFNSFMAVTASFWDGLTNPHSTPANENRHKKLNERQIDKMVEDSFPASDPPSTY